MDELINLRFEMEELYEETEQVSSLKVWVIGSASGFWLGKGVSGVSVWKPMDRGLPVGGRGCSL